MDEPEAGGIVLAAGRSTRMDAPKALLPARGRSFLAATVETLREGGCDPVVAVLPGWDDALRADVAAEAERTGVVAVGNPDRYSEQVESLRRGLAALPPKAEAAVVLPVDHPLVRPDTVAALLTRWREQPGRIVRPVYDGAPGHPTVFPRAAWSDLVREDLPQGARTVVEDGLHEREDVAVDDEGVVADIDTAEAYERWLGAR